MAGGDITATLRGNAVKLRLSTCMYLGHRCECVFRNSAETGTDDAVLRACARHRLAPGEYWLQLPQDALRAFQEGRSRQKKSRGKAGEKQEKSGRKGGGAVR